MLTQVQQPGSTSSYQYIHGSTYPAFYTATSNYAPLKSDFKYVFKTYTSDGLVGNTKNSPRILENLGVYDSVPVVKSLVGSTFQPTISNWTPCPDSIKQYRVDLQEFYDGATISTTLNYQKTLVMKQNLEGDYFSNYLLNADTKKFLTDKTGVTPIRLTDYATLRCLKLYFIERCSAPDDLWSWENCANSCIASIAKSSKIFLVFCNSVAII